jgi:hypothetical protein
MGKPLTFIYSVRKEDDLSCLSNIKETRIHSCNIYLNLRRLNLVSVVLSSGIDKIDGFCIAAGLCSTRVK